MMPRDERGRFTGHDAGPASGRPASGRPAQPYEPGNTAAVKSGARSPRFVDPVAAELGRALLAARPDLEAYPEAVAAWARAEARCLLYAEYHAQVGPLDEDGNLRGGRHVMLAERMAQTMRERLGLDPRAEADLHKARAEAIHATADLEAIRARGREVAQRRRAELLGDRSGARQYRAALPAAPATDLAGPYREDLEVGEHGEHG